MKTLAMVCILAITPLAAFGRLIPAMTYQQMYDRSDLVLIGRPTTTSDTSEKGKLPGGPTSWQVVGLATGISVSLVLKGDKALKQCTLHHYRQSEPGRPLENGPHFVVFTNNEKNSYLMFLKREADGKYAPVSGQEDPALFSILRLDGVAK